MATNMHAEDAKEFCRALIDAGLCRDGDEIDYKKVANELDISVSYVKQMSDGRQRFSKQMREKLGYDKGVQALKEINKVFENELKTEPSVTKSQNYEIMRDGDLWCICQMQWVTVATARDEDIAQKICDTLNNH